MRILLTNHFPYHGSGTGTYVKDLAAALRAAGHEVAALIVDGAKVSAGVADDPCATTRIVCAAGRRAADLDFDFPCFTGHPRSSRLFGELSTDEVRDYIRVNRERLRTVLRAFAPDVVHCQHIWVQSDLMRSLRVPYVVSAQGTELMGYAAFARFRPSAQRAAAGAARILAASHYIAERVVATFPGVETRIETVHSAVDPTLYQRCPAPRETALRKLGLPADGRPVVAFLGKLVPSKGVELLLEAARLYSQSGLAVRTVVCGDGPLRAKLQALAEEAAPGAVRFIGDRQIEDRVLLLQVADLVVVPSRAEPFGLVALEAMASGTPVVATRAGGIVEIVSHDVGVLVEPNDPRSLAHAVLRAISEGWKRTRSEAAKRHAASRYHPRDWIARLERAYEHAMRQTKPAELKHV